MSVWETTRILSLLQQEVPYFAYTINGKALDIYYGPHKITTLSLQRELTVFEGGYSLHWGNSQWNICRTAEEAVMGAINIIRDAPAFGPYHLLHAMKMEIETLKIKLIELESREQVVFPIYATAAPTTPTEQQPPQQSQEPQSQSFTFPSPPPPPAPPVIPAPPAFIIRDDYATPISSPSNNIEWEEIESDDS